MDNAEEPRELFPVTLFAGRPRLGVTGGVVKDFRAKPIPASLPIVPLASPAVEPDPKALSSAMDSVTPSQPGSEQTGSSPIQILTPEEIARIFQSDGPDSPVSAEKVLPPIEPESKTTSGEPKQPVEITGKDGAPAVDPTLSSPDAGIPRTRL